MHTKASHTESVRFRSELLRRKPVTVSDFFTLRTTIALKEPSATIVVPVRIAGNAVVRNRIRRQVGEALRRISEWRHSGLHLAITIRRPDIPTGAELHRTLFELLKESGIISQ